MLRLFRFLLALCALLGALLLAVSLTPLVGWMSRDMAVDWFEGDADVLVVLGGSMLVDGTGPQSTLGYDSYLRCTYASWILQRYRYSDVILSGADGIAENMAKLLRQTAANLPQVLIENAARSTAQNAEFVKNILAHQPHLPQHPSIVILTSDYHTRRAHLVFEHQGMQVRVIPVPDLAKRIRFPAQRWDAFLTLSEELLKDAFYKVTGRI